MQQLAVSPIGIHSGTAKFVDSATLNPVLNPK
jgi:hypothetical protein